MPVYSDITILPIPTEVGRRIAAFVFLVASLTDFWMALLPERTIVLLLLESS